MVVGRQRLHADGPELSRLVWGAWRSITSPETDSATKLAQLIETCLELGITSFDHAVIYGGYQAEAPTSRRRSSVRCVPSAPAMSTFFSCTVPIR